MNGLESYLNTFDPVEPCQACKGTGKYLWMKKVFDGTKAVYVRDETCPACKGSGLEQYEKCPKCGRWNDTTWEWTVDEVFYRCKCEIPKEGA